MIVWLAWFFARIGYWIRPYDMLADRRRWFWQPRQHCVRIVDVRVSQPGGIGPVDQP